jgi:hypothetical protein
MFPTVPLHEAVQICKVIAERNSGKPMRRLDVFQELRRSPDSGPSRTLVTASAGFELTSGSYRADYLQLTDIGRRYAVLGDQTALIDAVLEVDVFKRFFETYRNETLPSATAARSFFADNGVSADRTDACLQILLESGRFAGLIGEVSGTERLLARDHAIEKMGKQPVGEQKADAGVAEKPPVVDSKDGKRVQLPSLNINLEIHLPADATTETYDAIFSSMRKHLLDAE